MKATEGRALRRAHHRLAPISGNVGPVAHWLRLPNFSTGADQLWLAGRAVQLGADQGGMFVDDCCTWSWQLDGVDRNFGDATAYSAGEHMVTLRATAGDGTFAEERRTFSVGTLPPVAGFTAADSILTSTSADPDGGPVAIAWDLDGDRQFDDAFGPTARALPGEYDAGVAATDAGGDIGITYAPATGAPLLPALSFDPGEPARLRLTTSLKTPKRATLLKHGLTIIIHCTFACQTTARVTSTPRRRSAPSCTHASSAAAAPAVDHAGEAHRRGAHCVQAAAFVQAPRRGHVHKPGHGAATAVKTLTIRR